jgi:hypothetical protein
VEKLFPLPTFQWETHGVCTTKPLTNDGQFVPSPSLPSTYLNCRHVDQYEPPLSPQITSLTCRPFRANQSQSSESHTFPSARRIRFIPTNRQSQLSPPKLTFLAQNGERNFKPPWPAGLHSTRVLPQQRFRMFRDTHSTSATSLSPLPSPSEAQPPYFSFWEQPSASIGETSRQYRVYLPSSPQHHRLFHLFLSLFQRLLITLTPGGVRKNRYHSLALMPL